MRRDWDFVTIDDYASDMREQASHAAGILSAQRREIDMLRRTVAAACRQLNAPIKVYSGDLEKLQPPVLVTSRDAANDLYLVALE